MKILGRLMKEFAYKNVMQAPRLVKVNLNMGLGEAIQNVKFSMRRGRIDGHCRTKSGHNQGQTFHRGFQAAGRNADRRNRNFTSRQNVLFSR